MVYKLMFVTAFKNMGRLFLEVLVSLVFIEGFTGFCYFNFLQDDPEPSKCLGIFGLSLYTQERDLRDVFGRYGEMEECNVVYDRQSGRSRGFAFIYYRNIDDAIEVS